jgi:hypothetical protein
MNGMVSVVLGCLASAVAGYWLSALCSGKEPGQRGKMPSLKFRVNDYTVHLHHWLCASFVVVAFPGTMRIHITLLFFFVGIIIHGLTYPDFYKVIYRQATTEEHAR